MANPLKSPSTIAAVLAGATGIGLILWAWDLPPFDTAVETTDNAYVRGKVTFVAPQAAGHIAEVRVRDFQQVHAGDVLVQIDDRIYRQNLAQAQAQLEQQQAGLANWEQSKASAEAAIAAAEANVESAQATLRAAQANWDRTAPLRERGVVNQVDADDARAALDSGRAALHQQQANLEIARQDLQTVQANRASLVAAVDGARASVELARIDLDNTTVTAPEDGRVGQVSATVGQYVSAGTQLMGLVPDRVWVVANFKETQVAGMKAGQLAQIRVDALGRDRLTGHVESFSPATGSEFSVIKTDNATGNFTKVAQRVPVRIGFDAGQPQAERLVPGLSVEVTIDTDAAPDRPAEGVAAAN
ncbi:HlyD family secretion protein [Frigidibacter sp. MR17.24]|uniref:HlyD family secretion protein n=1 Tax=Frigidibacter sp. MR17.24 TaxID=3127345 RepID=UPI003013049F